MKISPFFCITWHLEDFIAHLCQPKTHSSLFPAAYALTSFSRLSSIYLLPRSIGLYHSKFVAAFKPLFFHDLLWPWQMIVDVTQPQLNWIDLCRGAFWERK